ncbi:RHS repeat-associated core domain-containing protein [Sphaerisporangium sp. NPDC051017]|uniref:RHS repeat domain-containing protein n=1 Tax=Sphaerisporangium sp. NPDC051017 TaxID=3154636 RepID=UPI003420C938
MITKWTQNAQGRWTVKAVTPSAQEAEVAYVRDAQGRYTRLLAPVPSGVTCDTSLIKGCKALDISYATTTTASGVASGWGDFAGQVKQLSYVAYDVGTNAMKTTVVTTYAYDSTGHLRSVTDARRGLTTVYYYNAQGRLSQITPPGVEAWRLDYDSAGRVAHAARTTPQGETVFPVVYDVPVSGTGAPVNLSAAETATWGQTTDLPWIGAALFPASHVPARGGDGAYAPGAADWPYGSLSYLDVSGRTVNTAEFGGGGWQISTTRYDDKGVVTWSLTPENRRRALAPDWTTAPFVAAQQDSSARANLLANIRTYDEKGDLRITTGPVHEVTLSDGRRVPARGRTTYTYDEGKPTSGVDEFGTLYRDKSWHLVTSVRTEPLVMDGDTSVPAGDVSVTKTGYDPVELGDESGWKLGTPTTESVVVGNGNPDSVKRMRYDSAGRLVESRAPAGNGAGDAVVTTYYTAAANVAYPQCGNKSEWAGMVCRQAPKQQPPGTPLPVDENTAYDYYGAILSKKRTVGSVVRTSSTTYDGAGRVSGMNVMVTPAAAGGAPVAERTVDYDPATGLPTSMTADGKTLTSTYDSLGREVTSTDATGNVAVTTYDIDGRVVSVGDGKGVNSYVYDGVDARGQQERRGLLTAIQTSAGTFQAAYSADRKADLQVYPNGLWAAGTYDSSGRQTGFSYGMDRTTWQPWLKWEDQADYAGNSTQTVSPQSVNRYTYDRLGRLSKVEDVFDSTHCTTRVYAFDDHFNRTRRDAYGPAQDGSCSTAATPVTDSYSYDDARRIINTGYVYDTFGRTTTVPGAHVDGGEDLTVGYYADDEVAQITQGAEAKVFTLDPAGRVLSETKTGGDDPGTFVHHYAGSGGSPAWISKADGSWTRYVTGFGGMAMVQTSTNQTKFYLTNPHGDVVATVQNSPSPTGVDYYTEYTEYGSARVANAGDDRYGWLGGAQRPTETIGGLTRMGDRLYNPVTGRFLQPDDFLTGVVCNSYGYVCGDPVNSADSGKAALPGPVRCQVCIDEYKNIKPKDKEGIACVWSFGYDKCKWGKQLADAAAQFARKKVGEKETPLRSAIRHFIWQVLETIAFGTEFAKEIADNHEKYHANSKKESDFDQEINRIARDYARIHEKELRKMWKEKGLDALMEYLFDEAMFLFCNAVIGGFKIDCHQVSGVARAPEGTHTRFF